MFAVVDIGSNSVRLVVFEALSRAPAVAFNEKATCGLGRGVALTGLLPADGVERALAALARFRVLIGAMRVDSISAVATSAAREARNGADFMARAQEALGAPIEILEGAGEARLAAQGVVSGFFGADGVIGDLGGGSLELAEIAHGAPQPGYSFPLGSLSLADLSGGDPRRAARIVRDSLSVQPGLSRLAGRDFFAIGGTWRALARTHMRVMN